MTDSIEKLSDGLWVPSHDAQIEQWREKGYPHMQEKCLNRFLEWCKTENKKFTRVVDIGAWCGTWSLAMQEFAENINCYEPSKVHFSCLVKNLSKHDHINLYNHAIGDSNGFIQLTEESATQNTRVKDEKGDTAIYKLDELNLKDVDMIKIDVEGYEMKVLKGATKTLENVKFIMVELNHNTEKYGSSSLAVKKYIKDELGFDILMNVWPDIIYYKNDV